MPGESGPRAEAWDSPQGPEHSRTHTCSVEEVHPREGMPRGEESQTPVHQLAGTRQCTPPHDLPQRAGSRGVPSEQGLAPLEDGPCCSPHSGSPGR